MVERVDPMICGVCARRAAGYGYGPNPFRVRQWTPIWVCDDPQCLRIAKDTHPMSQTEFDRIENLAADEGGRALEKYCDEIGKYDLRELTQEQFDIAVRRVIGDYRLALKEKLVDEAPF